MSVRGESPRASVLRSTGAPPPADGAKRQAPFDPLRLCIYTTILAFAAKGR